MLIVLFEYRSPAQIVCWLFEPTVSQTECWTKWSEADNAWPAFMTTFDLGTGSSARFSTLVFFQSMERVPYHAIRSLIDVDSNSNNSPSLCFFIHTKSRSSTTSGFYPWADRLCPMNGLSTWMSKAVNVPSSWPHPIQKPQVRDFRYSCMFPDIYRCSYADVAYIYPVSLRMWITSNNF